MNLDKGLLLEDAGIVLEWGHPIANRLNISRDKRGDRTIVSLGRHKILSGLDVELTQTFMVWDKVSDKFSFVEHWVVGDKAAIESFDKIATHLTTLFGQATDKDDSMIPEKLWRWKQAKVEIQLYLFEQHAFKTCLTIKKVE
jgi:hypothetical protein